MMHPADIDSYTYKQHYDCQLGYGCDDVYGMFDRFESEPILPSEHRQTAWILKQSGRKFHKYRDEMKDLLCSNVSSDYDLSQNGKVKSSGEASIHYMVPKGQIVNAILPVFNEHFSPIFAEATKVENTPSGKVRYSREVLLTFANFRSTKPVPDDIYKYIESNVVPIRRRGWRGGVKRRLRGNKNPFTIAIHSTVKCQINQPAWQKHYFL